MLLACFRGANFGFFCFVLQHYVTQQNRNADFTPKMKFVKIYLWVLEFSDKGMSRLTGLLLLRSLLSYPDSILCIRWGCWSITCWVPRLSTGRLYLTFDWLDLVSWTVCSLTSFSISSLPVEINENNLVEYPDFQSSKSTYFCSLIMLIPEVVSLSSFQIRNRKLKKTIYSISVTSQQIWFWISSI